MLNMPGFLSPKSRETRSPVARSAGRRGAGKAKGKSKAKARTTAKPSRAKGATRKQRATATARQRNASAWLNRLLIVTGGIVVIAAAIEAYLTLESLPVQRITVTGELEHTRYEAVQEMVQPALAGGFLNADLQRIRAQLEALPWIYQANVRRRWPNALEIHVEEQLPIARWGDAGFLNHEGEVFRSDSADRWQSLPMLQGPEGSASSLVASYQRLVDLLRPLDLAVEQLAMDERGQVEASIGHGVKIMLGGEEFLERMKRFVAIYQSELGPRFAEVERVDLRYVSGAAVAFRSEEQVAGVAEK